MTVSISRTCQSYVKWRCAIDANSLMILEIGTIFEYNTITVIQAPFCVFFVTIPCDANFSNYVLLFESKA